MPDVETQARIPDLDYETNSSRQVSGLWCCLTKCIRA